MQLTAQAIEYLRALLTHPENGINAQLALIEARDGVFLPRVAGEQVLLANLAPDLADEELELDYPLVFLFAEEAENRNLATFAWFSGPVRVGAQVRLSAERVSTLEADLHRYVEAVVNVLQASRGEWASGFVYGGRFSVRFTAAARGGDNFLQSAQVSVPLDVHM